MIATKQTKARVIDAIRNSGGIKRHAAASLSVSRMTLDKYLKKWPDALAVYEEEIDIIGDYAEDVIFTAIKKGDVETARWYARLKLRDRGYVERSELTGKDGSSLVRDGLTTDERIRRVALLYESIRARALRDPHVAVVALDSPTGTTDAGLAE